MNWWDILLQNIPLAIIIVIAIIICGAELIKAIGVWKNKGEERITKTQKFNKTLEDIQASLVLLHDKIDKQELRLEEFEIALSDLTISDMHDIKSWIVEQYHRFYINQGWIDAFNAETIDRRYEDYKKEGGNSYIDTIMDRLHELPMDPPINRE